MGKGDDPGRFASGILELLQRNDRFLRGTVNLKLSEMGLDSLDLVELAMDIEERWQIPEFEIEDGEITPLELSHKLHERLAK